MNSDALLRIHHRHPQISEKHGESIPNIQWIGLREKLQENPIFHGKIMENLYGFLWFPVDFP